MKKNIIISGFGGQGIVLAGRLLCEAAILEAKNVTLFPSYGVEMRGGTANCQIIISDNYIGAPMVYNPDILLCCNRLSFHRFFPKLTQGGDVIVNSSLYDPDNDNVNKVPANKIAEELGNKLVANMVMLGTFCFVSKIVTLDSLKKVLTEALSRNKRASVDINIEALQKGYDYLSLNSC
ncbi:2-oxoacid:acceptor oxidoreductase family protein [bacterium]